MTRVFQMALLLGPGLMALACGPEISDKAIRQSERFYEAAYISWAEERDNLAAIRHLTRAVGANPDNDNAHYLLGTIRLGRGEIDLAETHLRAAVRLRGTDRPADRAEAQNSLGVLLLHKGEYDEAIAVLEEAASEVLNREPWIALGNLGWAYIEIADYDRAVTAIERALFDQPDFCVGLYRLGQAHYLAGDHERAEQALARAVAVQKPGCDRLQEAFHLLGMARLRLGDADGSREAFDRCIEINARNEIGRSCSEARAGR
ncbi:MAG TPA: tetratricopeptide repeat protein [Polyangia bacterium]|nr:tetratricopeptide repeat protein [Polyangia bacterium]